MNQECDIPGAAASACSFGKIMNLVPAACAEPMIPSSSLGVADTKVAIEGKFQENYHVKRIILGLNRYRTVKLW